MQVSLNPTLFIFHIIDGGQSKRTIPDFNPQRLVNSAETAILSYLTDHGFGDEDDEELKTDDGYAKIVCARVGDPDSEETVWSYSFDGEVSLRFAIQQLQDQFAQLQVVDAPKVFTISEDEIRQKAYVAIGRNLQNLADCIADTLLNREELVKPQAE
jgi:hypothetical protein